MNTDPIGKKQLGLIGAGDVVELFHLPVLETVAGVQVSWICDLDRARAERVAKAWRIPASFSCLEECPAVDAVLIATPVGSRCNLVLQALQRGWHCFCEKPFAPSLAEHDEMLRHGRRNDLLLGSAYLRRFYWSTMQAKRLIEAECFGKLERVSISDLAGLKKTGVGPRSYRNDARSSGGGVLMETGCHAIDQAMHICGAQRAEVTDASQVRRLGLEIETVARGFLDLQFAARAPFSLVISGIRDVYDGVVMHCTQGQLRLRDDPKAPVEVLTPGHPPIVFPNPRAGENLVQAAFRDEWLHFLAALDHPAEWLARKETGYLTTGIIEDCYRAGVSAGAVKVGAGRS